MKNENCNPHAGHRIRLRNLIDKVGLKSLSDVQVIEHILTMTNARCDTNEIAHRLLDKFGSLSKILDADKQDLKKVKGVGEITAQMLTYLPQIFELYVKDKNKKKYNCKTLGDVYKYFYDIFKNYNKECFVVAFVDSNFNFEDYEILSEGDFASVNLKLIEITSAVARHNFKGVIVAHNHPYGSATPSRADYDSNTCIETLFTNLAVPFLNNVIIGVDGMFSFKDGTRIELEKLQ